MLYPWLNERNYYSFSNSTRCQHCTRHWARCLHIHYFILFLALLFPPKFQWEIKWYCKPFVGEIAAKCLEEIQSFNEWFNSSLSWTNPKCFLVPVQIVLFLPLSLNLLQKVPGPRRCHCGPWTTQADLRWMSSARTPGLTDSCQKVYLFFKKVHLLHWSS